MVGELNGLDYAILAIVGLGALYGFTRGALRMATSILSLAIGIYAARMWYQPVGVFAQQHLGTGPTVSTVIGYAVVFVIAFVAVEYAGGRMVQLVQLVHLNLIDRLGGGIFGAAINAVVAGIVILIMTALLPANPPVLRNSQLAPRILAYNQMLLAYIPPQVKKLYEEKREDLFRYWTGRQQSPASRPDSAR
jgi:membrane protein required for colicin V production